MEEILSNIYFFNLFLFCSTNKVSSKAAIHSPFPSSSLHSPLACASKLSTTTPTITTTTTPSTISSASLSSFFLLSWQERLG